MGLPFFSGCNNGWTTSFVNYDMIHNSNNLLRNQLFEHSNTLNSIYSYQMPGLGSFMPYSNGFGNQILLDPNYTIAQWNWNNNQGFNNMPWGQTNSFVSNPFSSPFGVTPSTPGNGGGNSPETVEEKGFERKYKKLLEFAKKLVNENDYKNNLSDEQIDALNVAIKNTKGTYEEKYNRLNDAYKDISKDTIREFIINNPTAFKVDNKETIYDRLLEAGFEFPDTEEFSMQLETLRSTLASADNKNTNTEWGQSISGLIKSGHYDILDVISSWNSKYSNSEDVKERRLIAFACKKYAELEDNKDTFKNDVIDTVVNALITKAETIKKELDTESQKSFDKKIAELRTALNTPNDTLSNKFDALYLLTRKASIAILRNDLKKQYGLIDPAVFDDTLFNKDTDADLIKEGFKAADISEIDKNTKIDPKKRSKVKQQDNDDYNKGTVGEQVGSLVSGGVLKEYGTTKIGDKEYITYVETKGDTRRVFIINNEDNSIRELLNAEVTVDDQGNISIKAKEGSNYAIGNTKFKASDLKTAYDKCEAAETEAEEITETENNKKISKQKAEAWGEDAANRLHGATSVDDAKEIKRYIENLDVDNVMSFLNKYYEIANYKNDDDCNWFGDGEGLIEIMTDDCKNEITIDTHLDFLNLVLEKAEKLGLKDSDEYAKLAAAVEDTIEAKDAGTITNLDHAKSKRAWYLEDRYYDEVLDDALEALHKKMKEIDK